MYLPENGTVIFLSPHPDDEIISSGALLGTLVQLGNTVTIHYLTSGSNEEMVVIREAEAIEVCERLGAIPIFHRMKADMDPALAGERIAMTLLKLKPDLLFMPSPDDPHPTHKFSHVAGMHGIAKALYTGPILHYSVWQPSQAPNALFTFSRERMLGKLELLNSYRSQIAHHDFPSAIHGLNRFQNVMSESRSQTWEKGSGAKVSIERKGSENDQNIETQEFAEAFSFHPGVQQTRVLCLGDIFLDILPEPVETNTVESSTSTIIWRSIGGNASNTAMSLEALGTEAILYSVIGEDDRGRMIRNMIDGSIGCSFLLEKKNSHTATTIAISRKDGSRHFISDFGCLSRFESHDLPIYDAESWGKFLHVHRAGFFWLPGLRTRNRDLLTFAKHCGLTTSLDIGTPIGLVHPSHPWDAGDRSDITGLLDSVDIFFGNEVEVRGVAGVSATTPLSEAATMLLGDGTRYVVIHRGDTGASLFSDTKVLHCRARSIIPRNPTGAGDIFNAGFIHQFIRKKPLKRCLAFAVAAGTRHVEDPGKPYPSEAEVMESTEIQRSSGGE
jgi:ribokinase